MKRILGPDGSQKLVLLQNLPENASDVTCNSAAITGWSCLKHRNTGCNAWFFILPQSQIAERIAAGQLVARGLRDQLSVERTRAE